MSDFTECVDELKGYREIAEAAANIGGAAVGGGSAVALGDAAGEMSESEFWGDFVGGAVGGALGALAEELALVAIEDMYNEQVAEVCLPLLTAEIMEMAQQAHATQATAGADAQTDGQVDASTQEWDPADAGVQTENGGASASNDPGTGGATDMTESPAP